MLTRLSVKNFRLLRSVQIDIKPGQPIVLIGPNSSGKSSVLDALEFLRRCVDEGIPKAVAAFGGKVATAGTSKPVEVEVILADGAWDDLFRTFDPIRYGFSVGSPPFAPMVDREWIYKFPTGPTGAEEQVYGKDLMSATDPDVPWVLDSKTQKKVKINKLKPDQLVFRQSLPVPLGFDTEAIINELSSIQTYPGFATTPSWARDPREGGSAPLEQSVIIAPQPRLDRRGLDLINALYSLHSDHQAEWDELLRAFCAEFPFVARLEFPADPAGGRVALGWRDKRFPGERMFGYHQMSTGMITFLCLLVALLSPDAPAAICFDEPDAHLHPSALRRLVHLMERAATRTAVFVATHSDRFLDFLSDPAASLRICEPTADGVLIRPVDAEAVDEWRKEYSLSQLRERGHLDPRNADVSEP